MRSSDLIKAQHLNGVSDFQAENLDEQIQDNVCMNVLASTIFPTVVGNAFAFGAKRGHWPVGIRSAR